MLIPTPVHASETIDQEPEKCLNCIGDHIVYWTTSVNSDGFYVTGSNQPIKGISMIKDDKYLFPIGTRIQLTLDGTPLTQGSVNKDGILLLKNEIPYNGEIQYEKIKDNKIGQIFNYFINLWK